MLLREYLYSLYGGKIMCKQIFKRTNEEIVKDLKKMIEKEAKDYEYDFKKSDDIRKYKQNIDDAIHGLIPEASIQFPVTDDGAIVPITIDIPEEVYDKYKDLFSLNEK